MVMEAFKSSPHEKSRKPFYSIPSTVIKGFEQASEFQADCIPLFHLHCPLGRKRSGKQSSEWRAWLLVSRAATRRCWLHQFDAIWSDNVNHRLMRNTSSYALCTADQLNSSCNNSRVKNCFIIKIRNKRWRHVLCNVVKQSFHLQSQATQRRRICLPLIDETKNLICFMKRRLRVQV